MRYRYFASIYAAIVVALGGFVFGFDASVISGVVGFIATEFDLNEWQQGFVVSSPTLGAVIGSFVAGPASDAFGRKKVIIFVALLYLISAFFSATAVSYEMLVLARFVGGLAFSSLILAPMYIAEISPESMRGKMISANQFNIVIGLSAAYFSNYYLLGVANSPVGEIAGFDITQQTWRWMLGMEIVPAFVFLILLFTIPESPRWLVINNKKDQALAVITKLFPKENSQQLFDTIRCQQSDSLPPLYARIKELFSSKMRLILVVGLVVGIVQQITGVNAIYFYAPSIFEQSGIGQNAAFSQAVWVGVINVVFTIVSILLIDKLGRKPLLLIGLAGIFCSMVISSIGFYQASYKLSSHSIEQIENHEIQAKVTSMVGQTFDSDIAYKDALLKVLSKEEVRDFQAPLMQAAANMNSTLILVGILGFVASFAVSLGPVMWVLLAEIFPNHLRGIGIAFTGLVNSGVSFTIQLIFPWELAYLGTALTFIIYGGFAFIGFMLIYKLLPETKGLSLEQVTDKFSSQSTG